jgi:3-methyladenine DNA glycosylase AlkD
MARYGIRPRDAIGGVGMPRLRAIAKRLRPDHDLALALWATGVHEARLLATMVDDPTAVTESQMETWAADFDSWDLVDGACGNLFDRTPFAHAKAVEWAGRDEEYVKRAGFAMMAELAVHDTRSPDEAFAAFLPVIEREARDDRNYVKKAANWALRQIGKRDPALWTRAIEAAERIHRQGTSSARWIASDALRELRGAADATARRPRRAGRS